MYKLPSAKGFRKKAKRNQQLSRIHQLETMCGQLYKQLEEMNARSQNSEGEKMPDLLRDIQADGYTTQKSFGAMSEGQNQQGESGAVEGEIHPEEAQGGRIVEAPVDPEGVERWAPVRKVKE